MKDRSKEDDVPSQEMTDPKLVELLEELSNADGVPGREDEVRAVFERRWGDLGNLRYDRLGAVVLEVPGKGDDAPRVAIECHMDEVGFMVRLITSSGLIKVQPLGGFWSQALPAQRLRLLTASGSKVDGVIGATPPHLLGKDRNKAVDIKDLLVDVGASSRSEVEELGLFPGSFAVPASTFTTLATGRRVMGKAFDNRAGCAVCIRTLEEAAQGASAGSPPSCTVVGVGSTQEEVGLRGVRTSSWVSDPDVAIVVEGSPADDVGSGRDEAQGCLGKGVQIRAFDPTMVASPRLVEIALEVAREEDIPHQLAIRTTGGTDAGHLHLHQRGVPTVVVAVPVRYAHSHAGVIDMNDLQSMARLVWALVSRLDSKTVSERLLPWGGR